jgi:hypothetical protein
MNLGITPQDRLGGLPDIIQNQMIVRDALLMMISVLFITIAQYKPLYFWTFFAVAVQVYLKLTPLAPPLPPPLKMGDSRVSRRWKPKLAGPLSWLLVLGSAAITDCRFSRNEDIITKLDLSVNDDTRALFLDLHERYSDSVVLGLPDRSMCVEDTQLAFEVMSLDISDQDLIKYVQSECVQLQEKDWKSDAESHILAALKPRPQTTREWFYSKLDTAADYVGELINLTTDTADTVVASGLDVTKSAVSKGITTTENVVKTADKVVKLSADRTQDVADVAIDITNTVVTDAIMGSGYLLSSIWNQTVGMLIATHEAIHTKPFDALQQSIKVGADVKTTIYERLPPTEEVTEILVDTIERIVTDANSLIAGSYDDGSSVVSKVLSDGKMATTGLYSKATETVREVNKVFDPGEIRAAIEMGKSASKTLIIDMASWFDASARNFSINGGLRYFVESTAIMAEITNNLGTMQGQYIAGFYRSIFPEAKTIKDARMAIFGDWRNGWYDNWVPYIFGLLGVTAFTAVLTTFLSKENG